MDINRRNTKWQDKSAFRLSTMLLKRSVPALCLQCARLYSTSTSLQPRVIYTTPNALLVKLAKVFSLSTLSVGLASVRQSHSIVILNVLSRYPRFPLLPFSTFGITLQVRYSIHHFIDQMLMHMTSSPSAGPEPVHVWRRYANETSSIRCICQHNSGLFYSSDSQRMLNRCTSLFIVAIYKLHISASTIKRYHFAQYQDHFRNVEHRGSKAIYNRGAAWSRAFLPFALDLDCVKKGSQTRPSTNTVLVGYPQRGRRSRSNVEYRANHQGRSAKNTSHVKKSSFLHNSHLVLCVLWVCTQTWLSTTEWNRLWDAQTRHAGY